MLRPSKARRRFHTDRIVRVRRARWLRESGWDDRPLPYGLLADRDPRDCGRAHCGLCHSGKHHDQRRARERRDWRADWGV